MLVIIEGKPIAKARHRHHVRGKYVQSYDPQSKMVAEVKEEITRQIVQLPEYDIDKLKEIPLSVSFIFHMPIPSSMPKYKRDAALDGQGEYHIKKPDLSNMVKFYEDASNGILWFDDSQIAELSAKKCYSANPKTVIQVNFLALE